MNRNTRKIVGWAAGATTAFLIGRTLWRNWNAYSFRDKVVLITGGSRGLGLCLARQLVREGARVAICARDADELQRAQFELQQQGGRVLALVCDVTEARQVGPLVEQVREQLGPVDVLINNAGGIQVGPLEEMTVEDFEEALRIHFWAALHTTFAVVPDMRRRGTGRIVNVASVGGKIGLPHLVPYSASKFALVGFSQGLRMELAKDGITVTTVCPGLMRTGSQRHALFKGQNQAEYLWFSLLDSLPFLSMSAERAARQTLNACRRGDVEVVLSVPARLATLVHEIAPSLSVRLLSLANRLLPGEGGIHQRHATGSESQTALPSWLTALGDRAALAHNQIKSP